MSTKKIIIAIIAVCFILIVLTILWFLYAIGALSVIESRPKDVHLKDAVKIEVIEVVPKNPKKNQEFTIRITFTPKMDYFDGGVGIIVPQTFTLISPAGVRVNRNYSFYHRDTPKGYMEVSIDSMPFLKLQRNVASFTFKSKSAGVYHIRGSVG